jgi:hypothetical protein
MLLTDTPGVIRYYLSAASALCVTYQILTQRQRVVHCREVFCQSKVRRWSHWLRGLKRGTAAARLLGLWVRIPPGTWMSLVSVVCCQVEISVTGRPHYHGSSTECGVSECDREATIMRRPWPTRICCAMVKKIIPLHNDRMSLPVLTCHTFSFPINDSQAWFLACNLQSIPLDMPVSIK